jgi:hypothetical protein
MPGRLGLSPMGPIRARRAWMRSGFRHPCFRKFGKFSGLATRTLRGARVTARIDQRDAPPSISLPGPRVAGHVIHIPIFQLLPRPRSLAQEGEARGDCRIEHETADRDLLSHALPAMPGHGRTQDRFQGDPMQGIVGMREWRGHEITGDTRRLPPRKPLLCRPSRVPRITSCASGSRGSAGWGAFARHPSPFKTVWSRAGPSWIPLPGGKGARTILSAGAGIGGSPPFLSSGILTRLSQFSGFCCSHLVLSGHGSLSRGSR